MDRMIYVGMAGAKMNMQRQDVLSHNLANVSTTGFRAELEATRAVPVRGDGASTRVYALETTVGYDDSAGPLQFTGRALDVAAQGKAWFTVQSLDGTPAHTRAGSFTVTPEGVLTTHEGLQVLGDGGPITIPAGAVPSIAPDGTVSAKTTNGQQTAVGKLKLVTPTEKMTRGEDGLFRPADGTELDANPAARVQDGALEGSNVSPIETMVAMIAAARQFETQMKLMQTAEQDEKQAAQLLTGS
ncbi:MAG: flagellar basal-body rod protein FlgF [Pseudomonadota bacterium]|jgi:flagellar basal-body rod protein FlgF